ncbi:MAG: glycine cleavage T C-terminal barrel domain-containing protein [bacterium]
MPSLAAKLATQKSPAHMLQNAQIGRYAFPIAAEFTNWIDEARAWRDSAVLLDQSLHMTDLYVSGPDTLRLLQHLSINSYIGFGRNKAKQMICCTAEGYLVGDAILFGLEDYAVNIVGRPCVPNWVQFHAETGNWNVKVERDERRVDAPGVARKTYRFEVQGPKAMQILQAVNQGGPLTTKFFTMGEITIAGCHARTLSHGMGGSEGLEIFGPAADGETVRAALIAAGATYGMRQAGARAYSIASNESGWIASPLPAIYSSASTAAYRDWLSDRSFEAVCSTGGSFQPEQVEDYYLTPWDLDYHRILKFDHDFIGRPALEAMQDLTHRQKVTLVWDEASVRDLIGGYHGDALPPKLLEWPTAHYASHPYDQVRAQGRQIGLSTSCSFSPNERSWISLAMVEPAFATPGTRVSLLWGEPDGGTTKPMVERHTQIEIHARVEGWPIDRRVRAEYRHRQ